MACIMKVKSKVDEAYRGEGVSKGGIRFVVYSIRTEVRSGAGSMIVLMSVDGNRALRIKCMSSVAGTVLHGGPLNSED